MQFRFFVVLLFGLVGVQMVLGIATGNSCSANKDQDSCDKCCGSTGKLMLISNGTDQETECICIHHARGDIYKPKWWEKYAPF